jgi:hypothetical protein
MQSLSLAQLVLHVVAPQTYAPHDDVTAAGQAPVALHGVASVSTPPEQLALRHVVVAPGFVHVVVCVPSQTPPQADPSDVHEPWPLVGLPVTAEQVPTLPATLHASQTSPHVALQQTPSAMIPDTHESAAVAELPFASLVVQLPALQ